jgi:hypothetical protein
MAMRREAIVPALLCLAFLGAGTAASADSYVAGNRSFVPTILTDDPFVADEISTTVTRIRDLGGDGEPAVRETDFGWEIAKRITPDLGIEVEQGYTILDPAGLRRVYGFDNVEATLKYQLYVNAEHEFLLSAGVTREFGRSGASRIDDEGSSTSPAIFFGKGMGDLPDGLAYLHPFAVTARIGYEIPDRTGADTPRMLQTGIAVEYSLRYLEGNVRYIGLPEFIDRLTPVVELSIETPVSHAPGLGTTGFVGPGLIYSADTFDIGAEALIPINRETGTGAGIMAMLHVRLEALFPDTIGRPLWSGIGQ